jgi:hypothetical protein
MLASDADTGVRMVINDEDLLLGTENGSSKNLKSNLMAKHASYVWDIDGHVSLPFFVSSSNQVLISNVNRLKKAGVYYYLFN